MSYTSRRMAENVSKHVLRKENPEPADRNAAIWDQRWTRDDRSTTEFFVLAFDADEALLLGVYRLRSMGAIPAGLKNLSNVRRPELTDTTLLAALRVESHAELRHREEAYTLRHERQLTGSEATEALSHSFDRLMGRG